MSLTKIKNTNEHIETLFQQDGNSEIEMTVTSTPEGQAYLASLLTDLYSNPIESAVRETVSNAYDAVIKNENEKRIDITIETTFKDLLTVKDNGVGMSLEDIKNVYSVFGKSNKTTDMDVIGAFGLGAKAPLQYCTSFTVDTIKDGERTVAIVSRRSDGFFIEVITNEKTELPSGTEIQIPIKSADGHLFLKAINNYAVVPTDVDIYVNGESLKSKHDYIEVVDDFVLNKEHNVTGRIWMHPRAILDLFLNRMRTRTRIGYSLGGWLYSQAWSNEDIIVEIKPGVLTFSSGREKVIEDEREKELFNRVHDYIRTDKVAEEVLTLVSNNKKLAHLFLSVYGCVSKYHKNRIYTTSVYDEQGSVQINKDSYIGELLQTKTNVFGGLVFGVDISDSVLYDASSEIKSGQYNNIFSKMNDVNNFLEGSFDEGINYSLASLYTIMEDNPYRQKDNEVIIIENITTPVMLKKIVSSRKRIVHKIKPNTSKVIFFYSKGVVDETLFDGYLSTEIEKVDASEIISQLSASQRTNTIRKANELPRMLHLKVVDGKLKVSLVDEDSFEELVNKNKKDVVFTGDSLMMQVALGYSVLTQTPIENADFVLIKTSDNDRIPASFINLLNEAEVNIYEIGEVTKGRTKTYEDSIKCSAPIKHYTNIDSPLGKMLLVFGITEINTSTARNTLYRIERVLSRTENLTQEQIVNNKTYLEKLTEIKSKIVITSEQSYDIHLKLMNEISRSELGIQGYTNQELLDISEIYEYARVMVPSVDSHYFYAADGWSTLRQNTYKSLIAPIYEYLDILYDVCTVKMV